MTDTTALAERESTALAVTDVPMPIVSTSQARAQMVAYTAMVEAVLVADDYQEFPGRAQIEGQWQTVTRRFKKKSAWRKLGTFFGLSVEIVGEFTRDDLGDGHFGFRGKARATAPNGRYVEAVGGCTTFEEKYDLEPKRNEAEADFKKRLKKALSRSYHDVLSTAQTRATNRAVSDLIGSGEVSAEEMREPREEKLVERAARLGIGNLREWCDEQGVAFNQTAIKAALDDIERTEIIDAPPVDWKMSDAQRRLLMTLHTTAGHDDKGRKQFYADVTGRAIASSKDLTRPEFDAVIKALKAGAV